MDREPITPAAWQAGALNIPLSWGMRANGFVFVSGCVGVDMARGQVVEGGIGAQTRQALENVRAVLAAAGSSLDKVVKVNISIRNPEDIEAMNAVYREFFSPPLPARAAVATPLVNPAWLVEIEAVALA